MTTPHDAVVAQVATSFNLPLDLLHAQMMQESSGDPFAFRWEKGFYNSYIRNKPQAKAALYGPLAACSFGLLQIMLETAVELGYEGRPEKLFEPLMGLTWGATYLVRCLARAEGDHFRALQFYNGAGPAAMEYAKSVYRRAGRPV